MTTLDKMLQGLANALGASLSTLTTTAKTVVGAINELKSGLTSTNTTVSGHTSTIGSGALDTTSQTLIGAVNEIFNGSKGAELIHVQKTLNISPGSYQEVYSSSGLAAYLMFWNGCFAQGSGYYMSDAIIALNYSTGDYDWCMHIWDGDSNKWDSSPYQGLKTTTTDPGAARWVDAYWIVPKGISSTSLQLYATYGDNGTFTTDYDFYLVKIPLN